MSGARETIQNGWELIERLSMVSGPGPTRMILSTLMSGKLQQINVANDLVVHNYKLSIFVDPAIA